MRFTTAFSFIAFLSFLAVCSAQTNKPTIEAKQPILDGSLNPDLISDSLAFSHLFQVLTVSPTNVAVSTNFRKNFVTNSLGLSQEEGLKLLRLVDTFSASLRKIQDKAITIKLNKQVSTADRMQQLSDCNFERKLLIQNTIADMPNTLGEALANKLTNSLRNEIKPHIRVYAKK